MWISIKFFKYFIHVGGEYQSQYKTIFSEDIFYFSSITKINIINFILKVIKYMWEIHIYITLIILKYYCNEIRNVINMASCC